MNILSKTFNGLIIAFIIILLFSFNQPASNETIPVGTVVYSILPPNFFESENPGWVLLDGRKIDDESKLSLMINSFSKNKIKNLPNSLGVFIRSSNFKNTGLDPDSLRVIGSYQDDATKLSNSPMNSSGIAKDSLSSHEHKALLYTSPAKRGNIHDYSTSKFIYTESNKSPFRYSKTSKIIMNKNGEHNHYVQTIVDSGGDVETRPKNISLYSYIKVN
ncbi:hypothetical protein V2598_06430 [Tenacibaculum maritimum]|uniref:hypothetical protein n=1 Tax=Tenacibaculum maritimum TaxID=107401 RepID=UPI003875C927